MIVLLWHLLFPPPAPGIALAQTAPAYLTPEVAADHVAAAELAAAVYEVDVDLLLSIAHHESGYKPATITPEVGGKVSCGVMTPVPTYSRRVCDTTTSSIVAGYLAGAEHLRGWIDGPWSPCNGNMLCAELGYAGGGRLIAACRRGARLHGCTIPRDFERRATWIRKLRHAVL